jgi:hypothetical protein
MPPVNISQCQDVVGLAGSASFPPQSNRETALLLNEFEKLAALLNVSELSERAPLIDRVEAAKLAARWSQLEATASTARSMKPAPGRR